MLGSHSLLDFRCMDSHLSFVTVPNCSLDAGHFFAYCFDPYDAQPTAQVGSWVEFMNIAHACSLLLSVISPINTFGC